MDSYGNPQSQPDVIHDWVPGTYLPKPSQKFQVPIHDWVPGTYTKSPDNITEGANGSPITNWNENIEPLADANMPRTALGFANNPQQQVDYLNNKSSLKDDNDFKLIPSTNTIVYKPKNLPDNDENGNSNWGSFNGSSFTHPVNWGEAHVGAIPEVAGGAIGGAGGSIAGAGLGFAAGNAIKQGIGSAIGIDTRNFSTVPPNPNTLNPIFPDSSNNADLGSRGLEVLEAGAAGAGGQALGNLANKGMTSWMLSKLNPGYEVQPGEILPKLSPSEMGKSLPVIGPVTEKIGQGAEWINNKLNSNIAQGMKKQNTQAIKDILTTSDNLNTPLPRNTLDGEPPINKLSAYESIINNARGKANVPSAEYNPQSSISDLNQYLGNRINFLNDVKKQSFNLDYPNLINDIRITQEGLQNTARNEAKSQFMQDAMTNKPHPATGDPDFNTWFEQKGNEANDFANEYANDKYGTQPNTLSDKIENIPGIDGFTDEATKKVSKLLDKLPSLSNPADMLQYKQTSLPKLLSSSDPVTQSQLGLVNNVFNQHLTDSINVLNSAALENQTGEIGGFKNIGGQLGSLNKRYGTYKNLLEPLSEDISKGNSGGLNTINNVMKPSNQFMEQLEIGNPDAARLVPTVSDIMKKRLANSVIQPNGEVDFNALRGASTADLTNNAPFMSKLSQIMQKTLNNTNAGITEGNANAEAFNQAMNDLQALAPNNIKIPPTAEIQPTNLGGPLQKNLNQLNTLNNLSENPQNTTASNPTGGLEEIMRKIGDLMMFRKVGFAEMMGKPALNAVNTAFPLSDMLYNPAEASGRLLGLNAIHPIDATKNLYGGVHDGLGLADAMLKKLTSSQGEQNNSTLQKRQNQYQQSLNTPISPIGE